jgi:malate permease and related proteins
MNNLILLIVCFIAGVLLRRGNRLGDHAPVTINRFIIHISLPAITLLYVHEIRPSGDVALMAAMAWIYFALAAGFFWLIGRMLALPRPTVGALMLTGGLGNTSFVGLPMIEAYYGREGMAAGIIVDQLGSFLVLATLGLVVAGLYSSGRPAAGEIVRRIVSFPPFIALVVAVLLFPVDYAPGFGTLLKRLGDTLAPLALVSVGYQMRLSHLSGNGRNLAVGLMFKLLLAPLLIYLCYVQFIGAHGLSMRVTLFEAAMPPMITAAVVAAEHDLDPHLSNLMVSVGLMLSFVTLALWWYGLQGV